MAPVVPPQLLLKAERLAGSVLSNPQGVHNAVFQAQLEFYLASRVKSRVRPLRERPNKIPLADYRPTSSFCTDQEYWFQRVVTAVLVDTMGDRLRRGLPVTQNELIATYLLILLDSTMNRWVDPLGIALVSILLGTPPSDAKDILNSPDTDAVIKNTKNKLLQAAKKKLRQLHLSKQVVLRTINESPRNVSFTRVVGVRAEPALQNFTLRFLKEFALWHTYPSGAGTGFFNSRPHDYDRRPPKNWNDHPRVLEPAVSEAIEGMCVLLDWFPFGTWVDDNRWVVPDFIANWPPSTGAGAPPPSAHPPPTVRASPSSTASRSGTPRFGGGPNSASRDLHMDSYDHELTEQERRRGSFQPFDHPLRIQLDSRVVPFDVVKSDPFRNSVSSDIEWIRVFGRDPEGELLLAVLPPPDPNEHSDVIKRVTLEGGQRIQVAFLRLPEKEKDSRLPEEESDSEEIELADDEFEDGVLDEPDAQWNVTISYSETRLDRRVALALRRLQRSWSQPFTRPRRLGALAATLVALVGAGYGASEYGRLLERYADVVAQLGFADPFEVKFSAVEQNSLEITVDFERNIVREVWVDWGDSAVEGEEKLYPSPEVSEDEARPDVRSRHDYGAVDRGGLRTVASVRIVPMDIPEPRPATLTPDELNPHRELLVLPVGLILDPPAWRLEFIAPAENEIVSSVPEVELRVGGVTAPIHLLAREASSTNSYRHLATLEEPAFAEEMTLRRSVDLSPLGPVGSVDIRALSAENLSATPDGRIDPESLPKRVPEGMIHLTLPAAILAPVGGATVGESEIVHFKSNIDGYVAVVIRPVSGGTFWIQNSGLPTTGDAQRITVIFGAVDDYEFYLGITEDPALFVRGDTLGQLPDFDNAEKKVDWVGPVVVHRME